MSELNQQMANEIERGQRWLSGLATPSPSAESIDRVKRVVSEELRRKSSVSPRRWSAVLGALAAAAAIALAAWAGWNATRTRPGAPLQIVRSGDSDAAPLVTRGDDDALAPSDDSMAMANDIEEKLTSLENWSGDENWDLTGLSLSEAMDEIFSEPVKESLGRQGA